MGFLRLNPVTAKRWRRFRSFKRAWISWWLLVALYGLSLCAELICNSSPLLVWHDGRLYFPVFFHYSADEFLGNGESLTADYRQLEAQESFKTGGSWMIWPPFRYGPNDQVASSELARHCRVNVHLSPVPRVGLVALTDRDLTMAAFPGGESLLKAPQNGFKGHRLSEYWKVPESFAARVSRRLSGEADGACEVRCESTSGGVSVLLRLLRCAASGEVRPQVWAKVLEAGDGNAFEVVRLSFSRGAEAPEGGRDFFDSMDASVQSVIVSAVKSSFSGGTGELASGSGRLYGETGVSSSGSVNDELHIGSHDYRMLCELERVAHPFRPVEGHWLGLDDAGRDVLARILYGLRTSLSFGLVLVVSSMLFGTMIGCLQGYLGGKVDMFGQRMIEIWSALPFLYVVILMGSLFGTGFWLLIVCYALFNWIGVSYYMRAEMLRLRRLPFVEAARCLGLPWWSVVWRHILPNALVPLVTFVPFSLVGAIGALAGLDYLGFGLPPPTPSLGQLLQQAQVQREAWWLILYPSVALFLVMLLCVFIGEGVREAFDPKRQSRLR